MFYEYVPAEYPPEIQAEIDRQEAALTPVERMYLDKCLEVFERKIMGEATCQPRQGLAAILIGD